LISEDLRNSAPADIFYEDALFIFGRVARFRIESVRKLDGCEVVPALLFQRTSAERILRADAIEVRV
jgi:hypothetical protein